MNNGIRWKQRFENFEKAFQTFCRTIVHFESNKNDEIAQMALVQAFEFTYELAWKTMKDYLEFEGFDTIINSRQTIRTAFKAGLISDAEKWMDMIEKRNLASHTYNENVLEESVEFIHLEFFPLAQKLYEDLRCKLL
jgi:nucleotidyltransferase substrate binding protein (TIGR01987 family)